MPNPYFRPVAGGYSVEPAYYDLQRIEQQTRERQVQQKREQKQQYLESKLTPKEVNKILESEKSGVKSKIFQTDSISTPKTSTPSEASKNPGQENKLDIKG